VSTASHPRPKSQRADIADIADTSVAGANNEIDHTVKMTIDQ